jgi:hypothetical protein
MTGDPNAVLVKRLDHLLSKCASCRHIPDAYPTPAADATFRSDIIPSKPLPERLQQFVAESPQHPAEADLVMAGAMQDFGVRIFRRLLIAGLSRKTCETDLTQNKHDVLMAEHLLRQMTVECANTPFLPATTGELLGRVASALHDIRWNNSRPNLFEDLAPEAPYPDTAAIQCEGRLAAALDIVIAGGMKLAEAKTWLDGEMRAAGLVDERGAPVQAARVTQWRNNFRKGVGAANAKLHFDDEIDNQKALLTSPRDERKRAACQDYARRLVRLMASNFNRTIPQTRDR